MGTENKKSLRDKTKVVSVAIITLLVVSTALLLTATLVYKGQVIQAILPVGIAVVIVVLMVPFVKRRYFDVKAGYPIEDERSKKVMNRAFAQAYLLSIWWLLIMGWASDGMIEFRDVSQAMGMGILGMAVLFGLCYLHYNRKEDVE